MTERQLACALDGHWTSVYLAWVDAPADALTWLGLGVLGNWWADYPASVAWDFLAARQKAFAAELLYGVSGS